MILANPSLQYSFFVRREFQRFGSVLKGPYPGLTPSWYAMLAKLSVPPFPNLAKISVPGTQSNCKQ